MLVDDTYHNYITHTTVQGGGGLFENYLKSLRQM